MAKRTPKPPKAPTEPSPAKLWDARLGRATKLYEQWEKKFECERLDDYYEGRQWKGETEEAAKKKYVINLTFATVETQLPTLLFSQPKVKAEARPDHQETAGSHAAERATLIEQTLQTAMDDPKLHFSFETTLALRDAYSRFAICEVGYTADWIDNPNAEKPVLKDDDSPMLDGDGAEVKQPMKLPKKESLYVRRLPPENFRASPGRNLLESNDWVAYYEWFPLEDVKRNKDYHNTADLKATGGLKHATDDTGDVEDNVTRAGQVKMWKIFDVRAKVRHVHADGHSKLLQADKPYAVLPLAVLKFFERRNQFYPLPPMYNWLSPQDAINEERDMQKVHRRRAKRFFMREANVAATEFEKLETGEDMTCIEVPSLLHPPIAAIMDAPLDGNLWRELGASHADFDQITGVTGEARGTPEETTATQANIMNVRASIRESRARSQVADWLAEIARLMLLTMRASMQLPLMVKQSVDPFSFATDPKQLQAKAETWRQIDKEDLGDLDVDVKIDVASLSPVAEDAQRQQWSMVLMLLTNMPLLMLLMTPNPAAPDEPTPLLRKTLALYGVKSDQEVREIYRVGQSVMMQQQLMMLAGAAGKPGGAGAGMGLPGGGMGAGMPTGMPAPGVQ